MEVTQKRSVLSDYKLVRYQDTIYRMFNIAKNRFSRTYVAKRYESYDSAKKEYDILKKLKDIRGVSKTVGLDDDENGYTYMILYYIPGLELFKILTISVMAEPEVKHLILELLKIVKNCHNIGVVHADIKPENIIYNCSTKDITLIDWDQKMTEKYTSPENFKCSSPHRDYSIKHDIWCIGMVCYMLIERDMPFDDGRKWKTDLFVAKDISPECKHFMRSCLSPKESRMDMDDAIKHSWFYGLPKGD